jgi:hypothetical protein
MKVHAIGDDDLVPSVKPWVKRERLLAQVQAKIGAMDSGCEIAKP